MRYIPNGCWKTVRRIAPSDIVIFRRYTDWCSRRQEEAENQAKTLNSKERRWRRVQPRNRTEPKVRHREDPSIRPHSMQAAFFRCKEHLCTLPAEERLSVSLIPGLIMRSLPFWMLSATAGFWPFGIRPYRTVRRRKVFILGRNIREKNWMKLCRRRIPSGLCHPGMKTVTEPLWQAFVQQAVWMA